MVELTTISRDYYERVVQGDSALDADYAADRLIRKFSKLRVPADGDRVLDVGSSTGVITDALRRRGLHPSGIDVVPEFVAYAQEHFPECEFQVGAAEDIPYPDETFDFISLSSVLEHVEDWRRTLRECARVLKTDGVLYLSTSNRLWPRQSEIKYFHGFGYLPGKLQRRIYQWAMDKHPELVSYTHLPAYHWLTWWQIAGALRTLGLDPHSWLQLVDEEDIPPRLQKRAKLIVAALRSPVPIWPCLPAANFVLARKLPGAVASSAATNGTP